MTDILSASESLPVQPGQVVVDIGANVWKTWANASSNYGCLIGIVARTCFPGAPLQVYTSGRIPYAAYNLGAGGPSTIVAGSTPARGGQQGGQVIGTCDPSGSIYMWPSYLGTPAQNGATCVGILGDAALQATPPTVGQIPQFDGSKWAFVTESNLATNINVKLGPYNAKGDGQRVADATITSGLSAVHSASADFTGAAGRLCSFYGAAAASGVAYGTIISVSGPHDCTVSFTAGTSVLSGGVFRWATDDRAAILAAAAACVSLSFLTYSQTAELYFPPGEYGFSGQWAWGTTYNGIRFKGASSGEIAGVEVAGRTRLTLFSPQTSFILNTAQHIKVDDLWICGNRLADRVVDFEYFAVTQSWWNYKIDGATPTGHLFHFGNDNGQLEIDFLDFHNPFMAGDHFDGSYYCGRAVYNENANAFAFSFYDGRINNATILFDYKGGSCNVYGTQLFAWQTRCVWIQTYCQPCEFANIYNEGDTAEFLRIDPNFAASSIDTFKLRNIQLNGTTGIYTAHTMRLVLENVTMGSNIVSDPAAATVGGVAYGIQDVTVDAVSFGLAAGFVLNSGNGSLIHGQWTTGGLSQAVVTDGAMSGGSPNLACATSNPFLSWEVGVPVTVADALGPGVPLNSWVKSVTDAGHVVLTSNATANVSSKTVSFGNVFAGNHAGAFGSTQTVTRPQSPSEIVNVNTGYDADGVWLGCGKCPVGTGVPIVAADCHIINSLNGNRAYNISILGVADFGVRMLISRAAAIDAFTATITYNLVSPTTIVLSAGQWCEFEYTNSVGWIPVANGTGAVSTTWANDLVGSTNSAQYVAAISGNAGGGGNLPVNVNLLTWGATQTTPGLQQNSESTATKGADLLVQPQQSTHATDQGGGNLVANVQAPTGAGLEAGIVVNRGGTFSARLGPMLGAGGSQSALHLVQGTTPTTTNYTVLNDGSDSHLNAPSGAKVSLQVNAVDQIATNGTDTTFLTPLAGIGAGNPLRFEATTYTLGHGGATSQTATKFLIHQPTDSGLTSDATITLPTVAGVVYFFDTTGLSGNYGGHNLIIKCGTGAATVTRSASSGVFFALYTYNSGNSCAVMAGT